MAGVGLVSVLPQAVVNELGLRSISGSIGTSVTVHCVGWSYAYWEWECQGLSTELLIPNYPAEVGLNMSSMEKCERSSFTEVPVLKHYKMQRWVICHSRNDFVLPCSRVLYLC